MQSLNMRLKLRHTYGTMCLWSSIGRQLKYRKTKHKKKYRFFIKIDTFLVSTAISGYLSVFGLGFELSSEFARLFCD